MNSYAFTLVIFVVGGIWTALFLGKSAEATIMLCTAIILLHCKK